MSNVNPKEVIDGIAVMCSYDKLVDIVDVIPNPRNPKQHNEKQIELLSRIIKSQGWRAPITVSTRSGFVVRGHGRLMAAQKFGAQFVPVDYQDYENEAQEWADLISDNRVAELADTDEDMLKDLLQEIKDGAFDIDLDLTGYTDDEIEQLIQQTASNLIDIVPSDKDVTGTGIRGKYLTVGSVKIPITDEEEKKAEKLVEKYVDKYSVQFGFVTWLCEVLNDAEI